MDPRPAHDVHPHSTSPLRAPGVLLSSWSSPRLAVSAGRAAAAEHAPSPLMLLRPRPRRRLAPSLPDPVDSASGGPVPDSPGEDGGIGSHWVVPPPLLPRGVGPALPGRRVAPATVVSLSYSARPPPPPAPTLSGSGGRGPPCVVVHDGPAAATTIYPPRARMPRLHSQRPSQLVSSSPPPIADPKPHLGPSGLGLPVRRPRTRCPLAAPPLPRPPPPGTPASGGAALGSPVQRVPCGSAR